MNYIGSFSVPPTEPENIKQVELLKAHCKKTGASFSHQVVQGIKHINEQLGLQDDNSTR